MVQCCFVGVHWWHRCRLIRVNIKEGEGHEMAKGKVISHRKMKLGCRQWAQFIEFNYFETLPIEELCR